MAARCNWVPGDAGNGGLSGINITNNGALVVDRTDDLTLSSAISGTGTVSQIGGGTLVLSGANTYSGATTVTNGTLELDQTTSGAGPVTATAGTVLSGSGVAGGPVTVSGELSPGTPTATGTFQAEAGLTLVSGSTLNFGLSASDPNPADGFDDLAAVTGNLTANNNAININIAGTPVTGSQYTLMTYSGSLSGTFNPVVTGTHFATTLDSASTPGSVLLTITGNSGYNLKWSASADGNWNTTTANWVNLANSSASTFLAGDTVLFDDTGASGTVTIPAGVTVYPAVITNSSAADYTIAGAGSIGGVLSLIKTNTGTLGIGTVNSFSGTIDVQGGVLQPQIAGALGSATLTIESNATLDLDNQNLGAAAITVSGPGVGRSRCHHQQQCLLRYPGIPAAHPDGRHHPGRYRRLGNEQQRRHGQFEHRRECLQPDESWCQRS